GRDSLAGWQSHGGLAGGEGVGSDGAAARGGPGATQVRYRDSRRGGSGGSATGDGGRCRDEEQAGADGTGADRDRAAGQTDEPAPRQCAGVGGDHVRIGNSWAGSIRIG